MKNFARGEVAAPVSCMAQYESRGRRGQDALPILGLEDVGAPFHTVPHCSTMLNYSGLLALFSSVESRYVPSHCCQYYLVGSTLWFAHRTTVQVGEGERDSGLGDDEPLEFAGLFEVDMDYTLAGPRDQSGKLHRRLCTRYHTEADLALVVERSSHVACPRNNVHFVSNCFSRRDASCTRREALGSVRVALEQCRKRFCWA